MGLDPLGPANPLRHEWGYQAPLKLAPAKSVAGWSSGSGAGCRVVKDLALSATVGFGSPRYIDRGSAASPVTCACDPCLPCRDEPWEHRYHSEADGGSVIVVRFNPPPNWPTPPVGWTPPPGWVPDQRWGPAPAGWQVWVPDGQPGGRIASAGSGPPQRRASGPTSMSTAEASVSSPAWRCRVGPRITAGKLILHRGRLRFDTHEGSAFEVPVTTLSGLRLTLLGCGSQLSFKVDGHKYRMAFADPRVGGAVSAMRSVIVGRRALKVWQEALGVGHQ